MQASRDPVKVLKDERNRINLFHTFWDQRSHEGVCVRAHGILNNMVPVRIKIESNYIQALEGLVFDVSGPAGSLKDALDELNTLVRIEINERNVTLGKLSALRGGDSSPFGGWGCTSGANLLTSVANDFQGRIMFLAKQKSWLTSHEEVAKNATLARTEAIQPSNIVNPSTITRLLLGKRTKQRPPNKTSLVTILPSLTEFDRADQRYRESVVDYNHLRRQFLGESMQMATKLASDESKAIAMIQKMISAFADSQSNFASALNSGSAQCRFMANKISPPTEGHDALVRIQDSISAAFGQPQLYKNFWFGAGNNGRSPTILFGYIPRTPLKDSTSAYVMRVVEVLAKCDPVCSLGLPQNSTEADYEKMSQLAHDLETCWDPEEIDGGSEVVRLLIMQPMRRRLLLHFLKRMPKPLVDMPDHTVATATWIINMFQLCCEKFNDSSSYLEREILSTVLRLLVDSSKDDTGVQWGWWDRGGRKEHWTRALTHKQLAPIMTHILPLWVHCVEYVSEAGKLVFLQAKFDHLHESWQQRIPNQLQGIDFN